MCTFSVYSFQCSALLEDSENLLYKNSLICSSSKLIGSLIGYLNCFPTHMCCISRIQNTSYGHRKKLNYWNNFIKLCLYLTRERERDYANCLQFFITLAENIDYLDGKHTVFGEVAEGFDVLQKFNEAYVDKDNRPYKDIRSALAFTVFVFLKFVCMLFVISWLSLFVLRSCWQYSEVAWLWNWLVFYNSFSYCVIERDFYLWNLMSS